MTIRRVDPMSAARLVGTLYALLGFLVGAGVTAAATLFSTYFGPAYQPGWGSWRMLFGAGAILGMPVLYGAIGFLGALLLTALYNWLAGLVGGIVVDVE